MKTILNEDNQERSTIDFTVREQPTTTTRESRGIAKVKEDQEHKKPVGHIINIDKTNKSRGYQGL